MKCTSWLSAPFAALMVLSAATAASGMYHPTLGRWVSRDPIVYGDDMTLYGYGASSPMAWIDPSGLRESRCGPGCCPGQDDKANTDKVNRLIKDHLERGLRAGMASPGSWSAAGYLAANADRRLGADTNMEMALYKALNTGTPGILTDTFAKCIQICGVCIGTDKLGHMFQQGQVLYGIKRQMMRQGRMTEGEARNYAKAFSEWTEGLYDPGNFSEDVDKWLRGGRLPVAYTHYDLRPISEYRNRYGGSWFIDISAAGYWLERSRADHAANLSGMDMWERLEKNWSEEGVKKFDICDFVGPGHQDFGGPSENPPGERLPGWHRL